MKSIEKRQTLKSLNVVCDSIDFRTLKMEAGIGINRCKPLEKRLGGGGGVKFLPKYQGGTPFRISYYIFCNKFFEVSEAIGSTPLVHLC
jgi:hypothetical protein